MQVSPETPTNADVPLQLLLFVDKRPSSREQIRQVHSSLKQLRAEYDFELQVIDVGEQPYLAEHFRLIATPALVKIHPEPRQTLAGMNLVAQLEHWWPHWQRSVEDYLDKIQRSETSTETAPSLEEPKQSALVTEISRAATVNLNAPGIVTNQSAIAHPSQPAAIQRVPGAIARSAELLQLADEVFRLKREKEELEHQLHFKDQILSMLAHDLRNPLTAASLALETLEMGYSAQEAAAARLTPALTAQLLKHARTQTRAIDHMITDILQAAKGANSELRIQPQKLNLGALCLDVLDYLREQLEAKSLHLKKDIPSDLPLVLADGERVRQVFINLLDNAIKYTPVGGTIEASILHRTTQKVQVTICDNGPGIPDENREQIFEERFRLQRDEAKDGYGIGLSLCQRIIRAHYGQIWVDSTLNQGSCFHFTLPVFRV
ncbi:histidine kinase [Pantanalinema sp. GBBB05]|uniref:histidine kinase n=1 Tax=Pantanalinema sp. GBBB05 TaxID=2604139 RepID=UPI001D2318B6|nr:histidine kinase [Pantanalinema sp. GBBB05]